MEKNSITVEVLRKQARELGIKNYKSYKKDELAALIAEEREKKKAAEAQAIKDAEREARKAKRKALREEERVNKILVPRGAASIEIYNEILRHKDFKKWTLYHLYKEGKYSYTNIRRVYKLYIEPYDINQLNIIE